MSTINELLNEQQQPKNKNATETEQKMTIRAIDDYLAAHETENNGVAWQLHCLFRSYRDFKKKKDYAYSSSEIGFIGVVLGQLIKTFMNPKASKIYCDVSGYDAADLADVLTRLQDFFQSLENDHTVEARLDRIEAGWFGRGSKSEDLKTIRMRWLRQNEIEAAEKNIIIKYRNQY